MPVPLHAALFVALSSFNPASVSLSNLSYTHLSILGLAALFFFSLLCQHPNILLTMWSSFILLTWPYHFSCFSVIFLDTCTTLVVPLMSFTFRTNYVYKCFSHNCLATFRVYFYLYVQKNCNFLFSSIA